MKNGKILVIAVVLTILCMSFVFAGGSSEEKSTDTSEKKITMRFMSVNPDRSAGQGKLEQFLLDKYVKENPNVVFEIEALKDEPYKQKFKAYTASKNLPDFFFMWGAPSYMDPLMTNGYVEELTEDYYGEYDFFPGSLQGYTHEGKIYGLSRNTDYFGLYYNKELFEEYNVKVPESYEDLIAASKKFRENDIVPNAINGKDKWAVSTLWHDILVKWSGNQDKVFKALDGEIKFSGDPDFLKASQLLSGLTDVGFFQDSFISADYGAAKNLFAQEKAAMYYMGAWEMGMATDENLPQSFRDNLAVVPVPTVMEGGKGGINDVISWHGGGYCVSADSKVKDEAVKLMNYIFAPENWAKNGWQMGIVVPAQKYEQYLTGDETTVQKQLVDIIMSATSGSGYIWHTVKTASFKNDVTDLALSLAAQVITPKEYLKELD